MIHNKFRYLLTLVALFAISTGAWAQGSGTKIYSVDFSDYTSYPFYNASESATVENGLLVLTNSKVYDEKHEVQPEIGRPTPITAGKCYRIAIQYKTTVGGPVNVLLGAQDWTVFDAAWWVPITVSEDFQTLEATFLKCSYGATDNHILFQFGDLVGTVYIKKVEVYEFDYVDVTGVTLSSSTASVNVGDKVALTATVAPDNATEKTVKWSVGGTNADAVKLYTDEACTTEVGADATSALTVYAKGLSAGEATVTVVASSDETKTATCTITVNPTYAVTLAGNTEDATSWTIEPDGVTTTGVAEGAQVTATYAGTKKVKSVQATSPGVTPVALTSSANGTVWTLAQMPAHAVELEVTYYTDEEAAQQDEAAFINGVELTKNADGTWTLAQMPGFDLELEVEYNDETEPVEPTHTAGTAWVQKDGFHYHPCTDDGCPFNSENLTADDFANDQNAAAILSYGEHSYGRSQEGAKYYTCQECQYVSTARQSETHTHNYAWVTTPDTKDGDNPIVVGKHWKECNAQGGVCDPVKTDEGDHVYDDQATDSKYYVCSTCNYTSELRKNDPNRPHAHEFSTTWTKTEDTSVNKPGAHYYQCIATGGTCPLKYDGTDNEALEQYGKHVYGTSQEKSAYFTCKTCGYKSEVRKGQSHTHQYGDWKHDASQHWKECTAQEGACYAPTTGLNYHTYYTTDNTQTPEDDRAVCSECGWYNEARKHALDNAALAALVQSWSWDYEIPFNFEAPVQNDRHMNVDQCYTVFLPYALELNDLKAYAIEQHNSNIIGFKEQAITELPQLTPYIVKAKTTGNPLSSDMTTVYMTLLKSDQAAWMTQAEKDALIPDRGAASPQASIHDGNDRLYMFGSLRYLTNEAQGRYIMQGKDADHPNGLFKLVSTPGAYDQVDNRSCVLPMRAYIGQMQTITIGGARQLLTVVFYDADGSATAVERVVVDDDALVIYDLQGRRVQNPRKGGLYIVNGVKTVIK
jgi:DNA-directed RNA polymerase subunit M/transcription elongation factor TFIIS